MYHNLLGDIFFFIFQICDHGLICLLSYFFLKVIFQTIYSANLALSLLEREGAVCKIASYWEQSEHLRRGKKNECFINKYELYFKSSSFEPFVSFSRLLLPLIY